MQALQLLRGKETAKSLQKSATVGLALQLSDSRC